MDLRKVYLDHAATTPVRSEVAEMVSRFMLEEFGNASSVHNWGRRAREAVERARGQVASLIGARSEEIVFTSGGTESDNLAIKGVALANRERGRHIITSRIEHHAVLHACEFLEEEGWKVTYLPVDGDGLVDPDDVRRAITPETVLVTIMMANNEVGTIEPVAEIGRICAEHDVYFHTDAVQVVGNLPVDVEEIRVDLMTISGHKMYAPKGVGALYIRKGTRIASVLHGGAHERGLRAGTENVPGIVGMGLACELAQRELPERVPRLRSLRDRLIDGILATIPDVRLNGHRERRLPNNVNVSFRHIEGEALLLDLDLEGIGASSGSACTSGSLDPSHVLLAMGLPYEWAHGSVRMTLGKDTTDEDIDYVLEVLPRVVRRLRDMSPLTPIRKEYPGNVH